MRKMGGEKSEVWPYAVWMEACANGVVTLVADKEVEVIRDPARERMKNGTSVSNH